MTDFVMQNLDLLLLISVLCGLCTAYLGFRYKKDPLLWFFIGGFFGLPGVVLSAAYLLLFEKKREVAFATGSQSTMQAAPLETSFEVKTDIAWYYLTPDEETIGPLSFERMQTLYNEKKLSEFTLVWNESFEDWQTIASITGLEKALSQ